MADEKTGYAPVSLPAGSFELRDLEKALGSAVSVKDENQHPERINKAIVSAADPLTQQVLAAQDNPVLPTGAEIVDQDVVYMEGSEPVKTKGIAFQPAKDAKDGEEASRMRYEDRGEKVVATDEAPGAPAAEGEEAPQSLSEAAAEELGEGEGGRKTRKDTGK